MFQVGGRRASPILRKIGILTVLDSVFDFPRQRPRTSALSATTAPPPAPYNVTCLPDPVSAAHCSSVSRHTRRLDEIFTPLYNEPAGNNAGQQVPSRTVRESAPTDPDNFDDSSDDNDAGGRGNRRNQNVLPHFRLSRHTDQVSQWDGNTDTIVRWMIKVGNRRSGKLVLLTSRILS